MITAQHLLNKQIPVLHPQDDPVDALNLMDQFRVADLPVVDGTRFAGMISETALISAGQVVEDVALETGAGLLVVSVKPEDHLFEVMRVVSENHLSVLPVVTSDGTYVGSITLEEIVQEITRMQGITAPGGIIVLEMPSSDYSLQQIARIVEENGAKILSASIHESSPGTVDINLKINQPDLNPILQSLNRFNYRVKVSYQEAEYSEGLQKRYEEFMRFLNI